MTFIRTNKLKWALVAGVLLVCVSARPAQASDHDLYHQTLKSTGWILTPGALQGTCWVVDQDRKLVITSKHVVGDKDDVFVAFPMYKDGALVTDAGEYVRTRTAGIPGKVLYRDAGRDLALVQLERLPEGIVALALAKRSPAKGDKVLAVGNHDPQTNEPEHMTLWKMRTGQVEDRMFRWVRLEQEQNLVASVLRTDLDSRPGDSGGPVVNEKGELVAVTAFYFKQGGEGTGGVDVSEVRVFLERAVADRTRPTRGYELSDTWKMLIKMPNGTQLVLGLTLRADGTLLLEGVQAWEGTWSSSDGQLSLTVPGLGLRETVALTWEDDRHVRFISGGNEVTLERR